MNNGGITKDIYPRDVLCRNLNVLGTATGTFPSTPKAYGAISSSTVFSIGTSAPIPLTLNTWASIASSGSNTYTLDGFSTSQFSLGPSNRGIMYVGPTITAKIQIFASANNTYTSPVIFQIGLYQNGTQLLVSSDATIEASGYASYSTSTVVTLNSGDVIYMGARCSISGPNVQVITSNISITQL